MADNTQFKTMEELLASQKNSSVPISRGQEVEGEVIFKDDKEILVDLKAKSEGLIPTKDLPEAFLENIKVGDKIKAFVAELENEAGLILLSISQTNRNSGVGKWGNFSQAKQTNSQLNGQVIEISGDGLVVEVDGVRGYLPASQMEDSSRKDEMVSKKISVSVLEADQVNNKLIFSQKSNSADFTKIAEKYKTDQTVKGKVTKVTQFGVFVQLEKGIEGLIHVSKLGPDDNFTPGQEITVTIDSVDTEKRRISLVPTITSTKGLIYK